MAKKDEVVQQIAVIMLDFLKLTELDWDASYFRYVAYAGAPTTTEWLYRKEEELNYFSYNPPVKLKFQKLLQATTEELLRQIVAEGKECPIVVIASVDRESNYHLKFDYKSPKALQIRLLSLGTPDSYFGSEIAIDNIVADFQARLSKP